MIMLAFLSSTTQAKIGLHVVLLLPMNPYCCCWRLSHIIIYSILITGLSPVQRKLRPLPLTTIMTSAVTYSCSNGRKENSLSTQYSAAVGSTTAIWPIDLTDSLDISTSTSYTLALVKKYTKGEAVEGLCSCRPSGTRGLGVGGGGGRGEGGRVAGVRKIYIVKAFSCHGSSLYWHLSP